MKKRQQTPDYKFLGNCPICNRRFTAPNAVSLEEKAGMQTFYAECAKCASSVVLGVIKNIPGVVTTIGMLTDMKHSDISRMKDVYPLTFDDVLELHAFLEQKTSAIGGSASGGK